VGYATYLTETLSSNASHHFDSGFVEAHIRFGGHLCFIGDVSSRFQVIVVYVVVMTLTLHL
jgi:hypothetical protein